MATYGERCVDSIRAYLLRYNLVNGAGEPSLGKLSGTILAELIDRHDAAEKRRDKTERSKRLGKGERDKLFEALAKGTGCDAASMTEVELKRCAVAISAIIRATPDVTVAEVEAACRRYGTKMSGATITPTAISSNWSKLFDSKSRGPSRWPEPPVVLEPDDWRGLLRDDEEEAALLESPWPSIHPFYQARIARKVSRLQQRTQN